MSKLAPVSHPFRTALVLCTIFSTLARAESSDKLLQIESFLNATIDDIKGKGAATLQKVTEIEAKFSSLAQNTMNELDTEIIEKIKKAEHEVREYMVGVMAHGTNKYHGIGECLIPVVNLDRSRISVIGQTRTCTLDIRDLSATNTRKISRVADTAVYDLTALRAELFHCDNMIAPAVQINDYDVIFTQLETPDSHDFNVECRSQVKLKVESIANAFDDNLKSLEKVLETFKTPFDACRDKTDYHKFLEESSTIFDRITECKANRKCQ